MNLSEHLQQLAKEFRPAADVNWVEAAMPLARARPFEGYTAETLAAAICTEKYRANSELYSELFPVIGRSEEALGRGYAGRLLIEIIQNAEDAYRDIETSGELRVSAQRVGESTWVTFEHDGKPFDAADVDGFRLQRSSTKARTRKRIGKFGVGIKAALSAADAIELHSGGFHLRFEGDGDWPVFACPKPLPPIDSPAVRLALRWKTAREPKEVLAELASGFNAIELLFLERLRVVQIGESRFSLDPVPRSAQFASFRDQDGRLLHRCGDPERGAIAFATSSNASGQDVLAPLNTSMHAYFRVTKCVCRLGLAVHAPFSLAEDRESLALASAEDRDANLALLDSLSDLIGETVLKLGTAGIVTDGLPELVLGPSDGLADAIESVCTVEKTHGNPLTTIAPDAVLRALVAKKLKQAPIFPTVNGGINTGPNILFGQELQEQWNDAFPRPDVLPTDRAGQWLKTAPRSHFGVVDAGVDRFAAELASVKCDPPVGPVRPLVREDDRSVARLRLLVALQSRGQPMGQIASIPHPVIGRARGSVFLAEAEHAFRAEDLERLGIAVLDLAPWAELNDQERNGVRFFLTSRGISTLDSVAVMRALNSQRRVPGDRERDAAFLRVASAMAARSTGRRGLVQAWNALFTVRHPWSQGDHWTWRDAALAVWNSRLSAPALDGSWTAIGDLSVGVDLPLRLRLDLGAVAGILGIDEASARAAAVALGASGGVPIRLRFVLPLKEEWDVEMAEFRSEVPAESWEGSSKGEHAKCLFGIARGERKLLWIDHPAPRWPWNDHGESAQDCAGGHARPMRDFPVPLADASIPDDLDPETVRRLVMEKEWLEFCSEPLYGPGLNLDRRASVRGAFPTRMLLTLRNTCFLRRAGRDGGRASEELARPRDLSAMDDLPATQWKASAKAYLSLIAKEDRDSLPGLDALHVVALRRTNDLRHLLRALFELVRRSPDDGSPPLALRAYRAAWRELIELIQEAVLPDPRRRKKAQETKILDDARKALNAAMEDAAYLGWIPEDAVNVEQFPIMTFSNLYAWVLAGNCRGDSAETCVFCLSDEIRAEGYIGIRFADLGDNSIRFARVLGIPVFRPLPGDYEFDLEDDSGGRSYMQKLIGELVPALRDVVTTRAPGGGSPMGHDTFLSRIESSGLRMPRVLSVARWPEAVSLKEPAGAVARVDGGPANGFLFERLGDGPALLVDRRYVENPEVVHANLWRLDQALANAVESPGHADAIQNLLRVVAATQPGGSREERASRIRELLGRDAIHQQESDPADVPVPSPAPHDETIVANFYRAVFNYAESRAAALVLAFDDPRDAIANAEKPWQETIVGQAASSQPPPVPEDLARTVLREDAPPEALASPEGFRMWLLDLGRGRGGFEEVRRKLERANRYRFQGRIFENAAEAERELGAAVDALPVVGAVSARGVQAASSGRDVRGGGGPARFSPSGTVTGSLGERYARRWLAEVAGQLPGAVFDVSTLEARAAAELPIGYGKRNAEISPGCDILVFERGLNGLPTGYEVKARVGNGALRFEMTRREREACERASCGELDPHWPLATYNVLTVSNLLAGQGAPPVVVLLNAEACVQGSEANGYTVRAEVSPSTTSATASPDG